MKSLIDEWKYVAGSKYCRLILSDRLSRLCFLDSCFRRTKLPNRLLLSLMRVTVRIHGSCQQQGISADFL